MKVKRSILSSLLKKNIILTDNKPVFNSLQNHGFAEDSNIYWDLKNGKNFFSDYYSSSSAANRIFKNKMISKFGLCSNAVLENPGFRNPRAFDFTLPDNSPALKKIGFEKWDYGTAGTLTDHSEN